MFTRFPVGEVDLFVTHKTDSILNETEKSSKNATVWLGYPAGLEEIAVLVFLPIRDDAEIQREFS